MEIGEIVYLDLPGKFQKQIGITWESLESAMRRCFLQSQLPFVFSKVNATINAVILHRLNKPEVSYDDIDIDAIIREATAVTDMFYLDMMLARIDEATAYRVMYYAMEDRVSEDGVGAAAIEFLNYIMGENKMDPDIYQETGMLKTPMSQEQIAIGFSKLVARVIEEILVTVDWEEQMGDLIYEGVNGLVESVDTSRGIIRAVLYSVPVSVQ